MKMLKTKVYGKMGHCLSNFKFHLICYLMPQYESPTYYHIHLNSNLMAGKQVLYLCIMELYLVKTRSDDIYLHLSLSFVTKLCELSFLLMKVMNHHNTTPITTFHNDFIFFCVVSVQQVYHMVQAF